MKLPSVTLGCTGLNWSKRLYIHQKSVELFWIKIMKNCLSSYQSISSEIKINMNLPLNIENYINQHQYQNQYHCHMFVVFSWYKSIFIFENWNAMLIFTYVNTIMILTLEKRVFFIFQCEMNQSSKSILLSKSISKSTSSLKSISTSQNQ